MWGPWNGTWHWGWGIASMLIMAVFWIAVLAGGIVLLRWLFPGLGAGPPFRREDPALEALRLRYARGEISKEEFEERKRDLLP